MPRPIGGDSFRDFGLRRKIIRALVVPLILSSSTAIRFRFCSGRALAAAVTPASASAAAGAAGWRCRLGTAATTTTTRFVNYNRMAGTRRPRSGRQLQRPLACKKEEEQSHPPRLPTPEATDVEDLGLAYASHGPDFHAWRGERQLDGIRDPLLDWYRYKRRRLPWRGDAAPFEGEGDCKGRKCKTQVSPYGTWVSEIMLQQTRVSTVISYYTKWMELFPTVEDLAKADPEEVKRAWAGLGYYRRARMLQEGAQFVVDRYGGHLPRTKKELLDIPGIGPYTAGAICSISFGQEEPVVDGNVIRVLARHRAIHSDPKSKALVDLCWSLAGELVSRNDPGSFNQAIMELGATVCTPQSPSCEACPIRGSCIAHALVRRDKSAVRNYAAPPSAADVGSSRCCSICTTDNTTTPKLPETESDLPLKAKRTPPREQVLSVSAIQDSSGRWLLVQRPEKGLLAGQWELPTVMIQDGGSVGEKVEKDLESERCKAADDVLHCVLGVGHRGAWASLRDRQRCGLLTHVFSHRRHTMLIEVVRLKEKGLGVANIATIRQIKGMDARWMTVEDMKKIVVSTGMKKALAMALELLNNVSGGCGADDGGQKKENKRTKRGE